MLPVNYTEQQFRAIKAMIDKTFHKPFEPSLNYSVVGMHVRTGVSIHEMMHSLRTDKSTFFSSVHKGRRNAAQLQAAINKGLFPEGMFCAVNVKIALLYASGHRGTPVNGHIAHVCIVQDSSAIHVGSPTLISGSKDSISGSHYQTGPSARVLAVLHVEIGREENMETLASVFKKPRFDNIFGKEVDKLTKIRMRKIRRKRMDNIGIKGDF